MSNLPSLVVTGASGFVGRHLVEAARDRYRIFAIARRPQQEAGVSNHPNVDWIQVDITNWRMLKRVMQQVKRTGGVDSMIHLAAYYDVSMDENPEYLLTNVNGTRHMLEQAKWLCVNRFLFASSIVACRFPPQGESITEETVPDGDFPYALSKRAGEELVKEYSRWFHCSIVRLAAVFSDWCEYPPLYVFLSTWLSRRWNRRILGGRGLSAVPYIHVDDVVRLLLRIIETPDLPNAAVYSASPNGSTSHRELFDVATRFYFGRRVDPVLVPKPAAWAGVIGRDLIGRIVGRRPFERPWMLRYLDLPLRVEATKTHQTLDWSPTPRLAVTRRLLFMIEKMKSHPSEWRRRNEAALEPPSVSPSLVIHDAMFEAREAIVDAITAYIRSPVRESRFPTFSCLPAADVNWLVGIVYELLMATVRTDDRTLLLETVSDLARRRLASGFPPSEICDALLAISETTVRELLSKPEVSGLGEHLRDCVFLPTALAVDGVQDVYEEICARPSRSSSTSPAEIQEDEALEAIASELNAFYQPSPGGESDGSVVS